MVGKWVGAGLVILACVLGTTLYLRLEKLDKENQETIAQLRNALVEQRHALEAVQAHLRTCASAGRKPEEILPPMTLMDQDTILFNWERGRIEKPEKSEKTRETTRRVTIGQLIECPSIRRAWEILVEREKLDQEEASARWWLRWCLDPWQGPLAPGCIF